MLETVTKRSNDNLDLNGDPRDPPALWIAPGIRPTPPRYIVQDLVEEGAANVLAGKMGSGKSLHALLIGMQISVGATLLGRSAQKRTVAFLDYEDEFDTHLYRADLLRSGHPEIADARILYRRCSQPLHEELDNIEWLMQQHSVSVLVVDSLAMAAGAGDLQGAEAPRTLQRALRWLPSHTSLFIAHPPKDSSQSAVAGSGFFQNLPRTIIQQQARVGEDTSCLTVDLEHHKSNHGRLRDKVAFRIHFSPEAIKFEPWTPTPRSNGDAPMSLTERIEEVLGQGPMKVSALAKTLNVSEAQIRTRLNEGKDDRLFHKFPDGQWGAIPKASAAG